jgi:hypothetical protein
MKIDANTVEYMVRQKRLELEKDPISKIVLELCRAEGEYTPYNKLFWLPRYQEVADQIKKDNLK